MYTQTEGLEGARWGSCGESYGLKDEVGTRVSRALFQGPLKNPAV